MDCQYCNKKLSSKSSLLLHQRKTSYCLKIQGKSLKGEFNCEYCGQDFTYKSALQSHYQSCSANKPFVKDSLIKCQNYEMENRELKKRIILLEKDKLDLQERYDHLAETLAKRSTITTTNNTINNIMNMSIFDKSEDDINKIVEEKYDKNYLIQGQKGVARFTSMYVLKSDDKTKPPIYLITDKSRGNGKYKVSESETVTDIGMSGLTKKVQPSIKKKAINIASIDPTFIVNENLFDGYQEVFDMEDDNGIFRKELVRILEQVE